LTLSCPAGQRIVDIPFASYGMPDGQCGAFTPNSSCHSGLSLEGVGNACVGQQSCTINVSNGVFGDPCAGVVKRLSVQARCAWQPRPPSSCGSLYSDEGIFRGQELHSCDGRFIWRLSSLGSLELVQRSPYMSGWIEETRWGPYATSSLGSRLIMQSDGNLVFYDMSGGVLWASNTSGWPNSVLRVQNDGNLVIYSPNNDVVWASNTCCH
jgi:hypothetical protein